jgi:hypothetical protein
MLAGTTSSSTDPGKASDVPQPKKKGGKAAAAAEVTGSSSSELDALQKDGATQQVLHAKQELAKKTSDNLEKWSEKIAKYEAESKPVPEWLTKMAAACEQILNDMVF